MGGLQVGECFVPQTNLLSCVSAVSAHVVGEDEAVMKAASSHYALVWQVLPFF